MLWSSKRKAATEAATAALRPLVAVAQQFGGMSVDMYYSPYVLGFMNFTAGYDAKAATKNRLGTTDLGYALQDSLTKVSNLNGVEMAKAMIELTHSQDPDFERGTTDAAIICFFAAGVLKDEAANPLVVDAVEDVDKMGGSFLGGDRRSAIAGMMMLHTFAKEIRRLRDTSDA